MAITHAGVVAYRESVGGPEYLVVTSTGGGQEWVWPKGKLEKTDASVEAAALRELKEEAGVEGTVMASLGNHSFERNGKPVSAAFFLVRADRVGASPEKRKQAWLAKKDVLVTLTFPDTRPLVEDADRILQERVLAKLGFARSELDKLIHVFNVDSKQHKTLFRRLRVPSFILTASAAVLAAAALANADWQPICNAAIVGVTALLGFVTAYEGLRTPRELWVHERTTLHALRDLRRELDYRSAHRCTEAEVDDCFSRLQSILGASTDKWHAHLEATKPPVPRVGTT